MHGAGKKIDWREAVAALQSGNVTRQDIADACGASLHSIHQALRPHGAVGERSPPRNWRTSLARLLRDRARHDLRLADILADMERNANEP